MKIPPSLVDHLRAMVELARTLDGHLTEREVRFLSLLGFTPPHLGEALEIGSFKGKSTVILAKTVRLVGGDRLVAVDPLTLPAPTDPHPGGPRPLPEVFKATLQEHRVETMVEFHQMPSERLASQWDRPLRLLWIDGDHTYRGTFLDFCNFSRFLQPRGLVVFHDTLTGFEGPLRVYCEQVLLSEEFGPCGVCGSIAWSQYLGSGMSSNRFRSQKLVLYRKLQRLVPYVALGQGLSGLARTRFKILRALVPHGEVDPEGWLAQVGFANFAASTLQGT